jgi:hypothetical protein
MSSLHAVRFHGDLANADGRQRTERRSQLHTAGQAGRELDVDACRSLADAALELASAPDVRALVAGWKPGV